MKRTKKLFALIASLCLVMSMGTAVANAADTPEPLFTKQAIERYAGATRYDTSLATADALKASLGVSQFEAVVLAYGGNFPDALAGGYLANVKNAPVITVDTTAASENKVEAYLKSNLKSNGDVYILGGTGVVTLRFEKALTADGYSVKRLAGASRYDTNLATIKEAGKSDKGLLVCSGNGYADSLSASAVDMPILLVNTSITKDQQAYIDEYAPSTIYIVGGTGVVSTAIEKSLASKYDVKRVAGVNRHKTSVAVAEEFFDAEKIDAVTFAYAQNFPDGLSGGPLAASLGAPMILTETSNHADAKAYRQKTTAFKSVTFGGTALIDENAVTDIMYNYMTAADSHKKMESADYTIIDVRKAADYETSHVWNSYSAPVDMSNISDETGIANVKAVLDRVGKDGKFILVCYTGNKYAKAATAVLANQGVDPRDIYTLQGGIAKWNADNANDAAKSYTSTGGFEFLNGISVAQAKADIDGHKDLTIIDVRDEASFAAGHIPGSVSAALCDESKTAYDAETQKAAIKSVVGNNKNGLFAIVCYSGNSYVDKARTALEALGIPEEQIISVEGGYGAWKNAGYPAETGAPDNVDTSKIFVDAEWLKKAQAGEFKNVDPDNLVLACVTYDKAKAGMEVIPGAINVTNLEVEDADGLAPSTDGEYSSWNAAYNLLDVETIRAKALKHGITADTTVVVYGDSTSSVGRQALGYLFAGVKDVKMLGYGNGLKSWKAEGNETTNEFAAEKSARKFGTPAEGCEKYVDTMEDVQKELYGADGKGDNYKTSSFKLVSIRSEAEFNGETSGYGYICRAGEPEGAVFGNDGIFVNDAGKIKTLAELNADGWEDVDFATDGSQHLSFYCGTGWRATIPFLICLEAGVDNVSVYDGGWYEWCMDKVVDFNEKSETKIHEPLHPDNRVQVGDKTTLVKYLATDKVKGMPAPAVKSGKMSVNIDLSTGQYNEAGKVAKVWVPIPESDENQTISNVSYSAPDATTVNETRDSEGNKTLYIEWAASVAPEKRVATVSYFVSRTQIRRPNLIEEGTVDAEEFAEYLGRFETSGSLTSGVVKETADKIVADAGAETVLEKAWAIYKWEVYNLRRIDEQTGCGVGDVPEILTTTKGGKCTDLNSTFVALCRAEGIPAREMFGCRMKDNATGGEHCRAEFYLPGTGWVQADPADTLKAMLGHEDADRANDDTMNALYKKYFGANDNNWVQLSTGRDITLNPAQSAKCISGEKCMLNPSGTLNNFGYIYGEFDGQYMQTYKPAVFGYTMSFDQNASQYVNADDVFAAITNDDVVLLDTRAAADYVTAHIPGAVSASCNSIVKAKPVTDADGDASANVKAAVKKYGKDKTYYVICYSGNRYADEATKLLKAEGVAAKNIYTLGGDERTVSSNGGMQAWNAKYASYIVKSYTSTKGFDFMNGITAANLKNDVDNEQIFTVVDLRTADLFHAGHIPGAVSAVQRDVTDEVAEANIKAVVDSSAAGTKYVLVCYSGNNFADKARNTMVNKLGVDEKDIIVLEGGQGAWTDAAYAIQTIEVDKEAGTASFYATTNEKFFTEDLPAISHFITSSVDTEGQKDNALFDTKTKPLELYSVLESLGATAWSSSSTATFADGKKISDADVKGIADSADYSKLTIKIYDGDTLVGELKDVVKYEKDGVAQDTPDISMAFSGNKVNQTNWNSGCVACIFSCYAGVTSNENIGIGTTNKEQNYFYVDKTKLQAGHQYRIVYSINK